VLLHPSKVDPLVATVPLQSTRPPPPDTIVEELPRVTLPGRVTLWPVVLRHPPLMSTTTPNTMGAALTVNCTQAPPVMMVVFTFHEPDTTVVDPLVTVV
jgi:hypothetical protein